MFFFSFFFLQFLSFLFYFILFLLFFFIDFLKHTPKLYMYAQNNQPSSILRVFLGVATLNYTFISAYQAKFSVQFTTFL